jgi:hypothetical protein
MNGPTLRAEAPLQFAAFEQLRRMGAESAHLSVVAPVGRDDDRHQLRVDSVCRLEFNLVTLESLYSSPVGVQQAMGVLHWHRHDRHDVDGLGLVMKAFAQGFAIEDATRPQNLAWRVLPWLPVPSCYAGTKGG